MSFTITKSDGTSVTVSLAQDNTYGLTLSGTGSATYPQDIAQNFVRHLENFANSSPPPGSPLQGQIWYDTTDLKLKIYDGVDWVDAVGTGGTGGTGSTGYTGSRGILGYTGSQGPAGASASSVFTVVTGTTQTAVTNGHYALTNVLASTVTLPSSPSVGDSVTVTVANGRVDNVVARNGANIMAYASDLTLNIANATTQLKYINSALGWWLV